MPVITKQTQNQYVRKICATGTLKSVSLVGWLVKEAHPWPKNHSKMAHGSSTPGQGSGGWGIPLIVPGQEQSRRDRGQSEPLLRVGLTPPGVLDPQLSSALLPLLHLKSSRLFGSRWRVGRVCKLKDQGSGFCRKSVHFKSPFFHEAFQGQKVGPRLQGALLCIRAVGCGFPTHQLARSCCPACLPARSRRPANTSGLNHELLSRAFSIAGRQGTGPVQQVRAGPPVPARRLRAFPGARGAPGRAGPVGRVSFHHPRSVRAPVHITLPSPPPLPCSHRDPGLQTPARPPGRSRAVWATDVAGGWVLGAGVRRPAPAPARPPRPAREATSPAAEWKPVRQVTNRWVVTVISQRMRHRSPGHSKLIRSDHPPSRPSHQHIPPRANKA